MSFAFFLSTLARSGIGKNRNSSFPFSSWRVPLLPVDHTPPDLLPCCVPPRIVLSRPLSRLPRLCVDSLSCEALQYQHRARHPSHFQHQSSTTAPHTMAPGKMQLSFLVDNPPPSASSAAPSEPPNADAAASAAARAAVAAAEELGEGRSYACDAPGCGRAFARRLRLLHHAATAHGARGVVLCGKCDAGFARATDRNKHVLCVHERARPHACPCGAAFFFAKDLRKHVLTVHERQRPHGCDTCSARFGKREHLTSHVRRVHERRKPFRCALCDVRLASKYNLQAHRRTAAHRRAEAARYGKPALAVRKRD